jgi:hypothetical protein
LVFVVPGKDPATVGFQETFELKIAADGEQTVRRGLLNGWKAEVMRISAQPNHG